MQTDDDIGPGSLVTFPGRYNQTHVVFYRRGNKIATARWKPRHNAWVVTGLWDVAEVRLASKTEREDFGHDIFQTIEDRPYPDKTQENHDELFCTISPSS